jgi:hypothetical protein|tara:strand:- start:683 stop:793 length:111 start_codon:yes stop_codon:yes gene_type:complete
MLITLDIGVYVGVKGVSRQSMLGIPKLVGLDGVFSN